MAIPSSDDFTSTLVGADLDAMSACESHALAQMARATSRPRGNSILTGTFYAPIRARRKPLIRGAATADNEIRCTRPTSHGARSGSCSSTRA